MDEPIDRYLTTSERDAIAPEDFAGPDKTFPCNTQDHLDSAAKLIGHAADPAAVKSKAISIAKRHGFTLPKSWQEEEDMNKSDEADILRTMPSETQLYMPILRVDREKREIVARATSEALDSYRTVFSFEGSKEAFAAWRGNVREMHDPTKAVGKAIDWQANEDSKAIDVTLRVSRGAEDTWQKVLDGTLSGLSVGAKNGKWSKKTIDGEEIPYLERYDLVEVSLVDNPANPDCNVTLVRADGLTTEIVDEQVDAPETTETPETEVERSEQTEVIERAGKAISSNTSGKLHKSMNHALQSAKGLADTCGCDNCQAVSMALDPDQDGDIDISPELDTDHDAGASGDATGNGQVMEKALRTEITRQLTPVITRLNGIAAMNASNHAQAPDISRIVEAVKAIQQEERDAHRKELDEVRSALAEVKGLVKVIAEQPQVGGPIVNSAAMRNTLPQPNQDAETIMRLSQAGLLKTREQQIEAALYLQQLQGNVR